MYSALIDDMKTGPFNKKPYIQINYRLFLFQAIILIYSHLFFVSNLAGQEVPKIDHTNKIIEKISFHQLSHKPAMKTMPETGWPIKCNGIKTRSHYSKKQWVYYESILYKGHPDIYSTWSFLYNTENNFICSLETNSTIFKFKISWKKIRPYLDPVYKKIYTRSDRKNAPEWIQQDLEQISKVMIVEYAFSANMQLFSMFKTESYRIPPNRPDGKPGVRKNTILVISNKPFQKFKPVGKLTPLFKNWSY